MFPTSPTVFPRSSRTWRDVLLRGLDLVVAFATLRDAEEPVAGGGDSDGDAWAAPSGRAPDRAVACAAGAPGNRAHPHRRPLRAPARSRRPGAVRAAAPPCVTPLAARPRRRRAAAPASGR
jgi:hypothetical protein